MNLLKTIKRILREETELPVNIRRRLKISDSLIDNFKKNSLYYIDNNDILKTLEYGAYSTADSMISYDDEEEFFSDESKHDKMVNILSDYLIDKYGDEVKNYLEKILPEGSFDDDGYGYIFWKHSERFGGSGFSESYPTWGELIKKRAGWFPIEWSEVKDELDKKGETDLLILKPGDKHNSMGYYFSILKRKKK